MITKEIIGMLVNHVIILQFLEKLKLSYMT